MKQIYWIFSAILMLSLVQGCSSNNQHETWLYPGETWEQATPQEEGVSSQLLQQALDTLKRYSHRDGLEEVLVIRNGRVIYAGDSVTKSHNIYSCSKSFTSMALGLLIAEGKCGLDDKAAKFEPILQENYSDATLRHFTTMTSGYSAKGGSRWPDWESDDWSWTPYQADEPHFAPGTGYLYWDENMMMLGRVLTQIAQEDLHAYLSERIMNKIQLGTWKWGPEQSLDKIPIRNGCTNIEMNATQLARIGYLYLRQGKWKEEQLVPREWVRAAMVNQVPMEVDLKTDNRTLDGRGRYGYNWWVKGIAGDMPDTPDGTAFMSGFNHNVCFVIPEWNMVVVRMGLDGNPEEGKRFVYNRFFRELAKAVK
ncbi:serine hydrolase domain-containing protein [Marinoscillum furvescens]|uniref:CubicO group peptidase (Beta-lactamase class C family) n=1 Tax=Marinoscillum furvescens DSM 4134 TaxID=1122208 RepID=A0A3D9KZE4_MARFU|nr:serine hydrolase [Marinoscillum furvescens]RED95669.1 CubicO group peptidase (beta-lactamase class C family) [Marinoscillum furvescens DSM 4134]